MTKPSRDDFNAGFNQGVEEQNRAATKRVADSLGKVLEETAQRIRKEPHRSWDFPDKWALIRLEAKRDEHEEDSIMPSVNGIPCRMQRGEWVPVNWAYVLVLKNATLTRYKQEPGKQTEIIGQYSRYPIQGPYEITKQEYDELKKIASQRSISINEIPERYRSMLTV